MKTAFLFFLSWMAFAGCNKQPDNARQPYVPPAAIVNKTDTLHYLALGDSYTAGQSVSPDQSFPYQLKAALTQNGYPTAQPVVIAVTGWTTADLQNGLIQANPTRKFDFVTLLIGVNNQFKGYGQTDYRTGFASLLNTAINFANGNPKRVFVLSIPDYSVTPFAAALNTAKIALEIDQFNSINLNESTKAGVNYLNITGISRQAASDPALIAFDGLHPSGKMYGLWVQQLTPMVEANVK